MASTLSDVRRRIRTTAQIRQVTGTLQKVAAARLAQDQRRIEKADVYFQGICRLLKKADAALPLDTDPHPLMTPQPGGPVDLIVFGSDRGLCGSFNTILMNALRRFAQERPNQEIHYLLSGKVVYRRAHRLELAPITRVNSVSDIIDRLMADFLSKSVSEVHVLYWDFINTIEQRIVTRQVLPTPFSSELIDSAGVDTSGQNTDVIEPSPRALIDALLPEYVRCAIHNGYYNSAVSENAQRQASMSRATENAGNMLGDLKKSYSRLRQESITTEMLEIVAGLNR